MSHPDFSESPESVKPLPQSLLRRIAGFDRILNGGSIGWMTDRPFLHTLGTGGQGTVLLAERRGAGNFSIPVALKFFSPQRFPHVGSYDSEMLRMAEVASKVARIQDDHLVDVHTVIENDGIYYLEMEWIDGYDLLHILRRDTLEIVQDAVTQGRWRKINDEIVTTGEVACRLQPGMAIAIIRECLSGVSALHRNDIIHCDLKPSNVMVKRSGQVKLIDIGSAYWTMNPPEGQPCTLEYAAPEVLAGHRATPQSDIASLGYMLLEMLTGAKPFAGLAYGDLNDAKATVLDRLPALLPIDTFAHSERLITLLRKMMHPDPSQRFGSAEEAELADDGAAAFLRELVLIEKGQEYASELRQWIAEMETDLMNQANQRLLQHSEDLTTAIPTARSVDPLFTPPVDPQSTKIVDAPLMTDPGPSKNGF